MLTAVAALQSQLNSSEGVKRRLILESEGRLESARNDARAIAGQIEFIVQALNVEPTEKDRAAALQALLELKRLDQLQAIAHGHGNSTYFFGDAKGTGRDAYEVDNVERWKRNLAHQEAKSAAAATSTA